MLQKKATVARVVAAIAMPETLLEIRVQEGEDGPQDLHPLNLTTRQRQGKLFEELDLSRLNSCLMSWQKLLAGFLLSTTMFFSLEPAEFGCTHSTKHMIKVTDDTSLKE